MGENRLQIAEPDPQSSVGQASDLTNTGSIVSPCVAADEHVFLIGRPPLGEFLGFVEIMSVDGQSGTRAELAEEWRLANDHIRKLVGPKRDGRRPRRLSLFPRSWSR